MPEEKHSYHCFKMPGFWQEKDVGVPFLLIILVSSQEMTD